MTLWTGPLLPLAALIWPLFLGALMALPAVRSVATRLVPFAPLPALWLAVAGGSGVTVAPDLLLGVTLELDPARRLLLGMTAALWVLAGLSVQPMAGKRNVVLFSAFWCVVLAGNLGVFLARDAITFYVAFAAVSLASWFLIVHDRTEKARHAARVYIVIAMAGEAALLVGLIIGAEAAGSLGIDEISAAFGTSEASALGLALLVAGFGIKAGMVPLHIWLPLAHPAAPVPGSAVLSGAIVKAGLFGMMLFVPEGMFRPMLMALGLAGAFGAALWGLTQANPKAVLAYSTISQMGLMVLLVGAGGTARETTPYFAMHHGLAKGALFLLVGVMMAAQHRGQRIACLAVAAAVSASVAGFPLTGGALAKTAVKEGLAEWSALALSLSSVATSLILVWFLLRLWQTDSHDRAGNFGYLLGPPVALASFALVVPWLFWSNWTEHELGYLVKGATLTTALWPLALAILPAVALFRRGVPEIPPGDLLRLSPKWQLRSVELPDLRPISGNVSGSYRALRQIASQLEDILIRWTNAGIALVLLVLLILALLL